MKKTIIIGIVFLLVISLVTAITVYNSKQEALNYMASKVSEMNTAVGQASTSITYTDDVTCVFTGIEDTEPTCYAYFSYNVEGESLAERVVVDETMTAKEIDELVKTFVQEKIRAEYKYEKVEYKSTQLKDREITI